MELDIFNAGFQEIIKILELKYHIKNAVVRKLYDKKLITVAYYGFAENEAGEIISMGQGISGRCALSRKTIVINDFRNYNGDYIEGLEDAQSEICVPIQNNGKILGILTIESFQKNSFDKSNRMTIEKIAEIFKFAFLGWHSKAITHAKKILENEIFFEALN